MTNNFNNNSESYIDIIKEESSIRKKQLTYLNDMLLRFNDNTYKTTFMKITVPELYAQYEGFFKFIFLHTIDYIKELNVDNSMMSKRYIIFALLTHLTSEITNQRTKAEKMISIFDDAFNNNKSFLHICNLKEYILNLDSMKHTMNIFGINSRRMPMRELDLLYKRRCEIAHGNISEDNPFYISPELDITDYIVDETYKYWEEHYKSVIYAIDTMAELFIEYISIEGYKSA
ncbi:MAE_28990/MAE_18760 family HEPN-like nuclease [Tissierella praeacuta]|uniref:MAE_28990/MAE_18760 family HEPN-like nuclease n=1 Tax=Tissierella praeacuta TaxID=43131 RepID=UPI003515F6F3